LSKDADQDKTLKKLADEKRSIITSNVKYRLISTIGALLTFVVLTFFFGQVTNLTSNVVLQIIALMYLSLFFYFPFKYFFANFNQISTEYRLNRVIFRTIEEIQNVHKMSEQDRDLNSIQTSVIFLRRSLMDYLKFSKKLSPVIYNYELNRLIIGIDKFFNVSSLVLLKDSSCSFS
jgi:uncharacterized protein YacL